MYAKGGRHMPSPISFGPTDPISWQQTWYGNAGGSSDPEATMTAGKKPPPPPPAPPAPPSSGGQTTAGPGATISWPNGFIDSTGGNYQAWFGA